MKAIRRFKAILERHRGERSTSPKKIEDNFDPLEAKARAAEIEALVQRRQIFSQHSRADVIKKLTLDLDRPTNSSNEDVTEQEPLFVGVGTGGAEAHHKPTSAEALQPTAVSESPTNADFNVYDKAYEEEVERILAKPAKQPTMYLTRLVEERGQYKTVLNVVDTPAGHPEGTGSSEKISSPSGDTDDVSQSMSEAAITEAKTTIDEDRS